MAHLTDVKYINKQVVWQLLEQFSLELLRNGIEKLSILVAGGSALIMKHDFRESTVDIDAYIDTGVSIKPIIEKVSRDLNIPGDWINEDFTMSPSFNIRFLSRGRYLTTINNVLEVYVVSDIDQLCMKLTANRLKDKEDILNLIVLLKRSGITFEEIEETAEFLYHCGEVSKTAMKMARAFYKRAR